MHAIYYFLFFYNGLIVTKTDMSQCTDWQRNWRQTDHNLGARCDSY